MATDPANGKIGQIYYNSADKALMQYDGTQWKKVGVVYQQGSTTGAVITGLDDTGNVTTTNVTGLTLTGYTPVEGGYVTAGMSLQEAMQAMDTAIKNAVAGGGEVNQNAWSNINVKKQSAATTAITGAAADTTIQATTKTDTFAVASGTANGAMSSAQFTKLSGIDEGATKNTITLNGTATKTPSFYAPTTVGTAGQHLVSSGTGAPTWQNMPTILKRTIAKATHGITTPAIVQLFEEISGEMVIADVTVDNNSVVTIKIVGSGTLAKGTYRVVIIG